VVDVWAVGIFTNRNTSYIMHTYFKSSQVAFNAVCQAHTVTKLDLLAVWHWLPVRQRITYNKLCVLMHGVAFRYEPTYLLDATVPVSALPGRAHLRSADSGCFDVPRVSSSVGSRAFSVAGPQAWNRLPATLRHTDCVASFKRQLKTVLFTEAYCVRQ